MTKPSSTALAVAEALQHYRHQRGLSCEELAYRATLNGYEISPQRLAGIEDALWAASVDDLVAISHALEISPLRLLAHVHSDRQAGEQPAGTGLPSDIEQPELLAWMQDRTALDLESRAHWHQRTAADVAIRSTFLDDQLAGARLEMEDLGVLALREADAPQVVVLGARIEQLDLLAREADVALAYADRRADAMAHRLRVQQQADLGELPPFG